MNVENFFVGKNRTMELTSFCLSNCIRTPSLRILIQRYELFPSYAEWSIRRMDQFEVIRLRFPENKVIHQRDGLFLNSIEWSPIMTFQILIHPDSMTQNPSRNRWNFNSRFLSNRKRDELQFELNYWVSNPNRTNVDGNIKILWMFFTEKNFRWSICHILLVFHPRSSYCRIRSKNDRVKFHSKGFSSKERSKSNQ